MKTKITRLLLTAVLMMCCMVASAVGTQPSNGDGSSANPYQIATLDNLLWFANHVNSGNGTANAILTADITMNTGVLNSNGDLNSGTFEPWTSIGGHGVDYSGEFNGNGHTISGLYLNDGNVNNIGLFGKTGDGAYIHDLGVKDSYFYGKDHVGAICGDFAYGKIENCWNGATVIAYDFNAGGISGSCWKYASIANCYNIGDISTYEEKGGKPQDQRFGGICGSVYNNENVTYIIDNCYTLKNDGESLKGETDEGNTLPYSDCNKIYGSLVENCPASKIHDSYVKNATAFMSGEICYRLNRGVTDGTQKSIIYKEMQPLMLLALLKNVG